MNQSFSISSAHFHRVLLAICSRDYFYLQKCYIICLIAENSIFLLLRSQFARDAVDRTRRLGTARGSQSRRRRRRRSRFVRSSILCCIFLVVIGLVIIVVVDCLVLSVVVVGAATLGAGLLLGFDSGRRCGHRLVGGPGAGSAECRGRRQCRRRRIVIVFSIVVVFTCVCIVGLFAVSSPICFFVLIVLFLRFFCVDVALSPPAFRLRRCCESVTAAKAAPVDARRVRAALRQSRRAPQSASRAGQCRGAGGMGETQRETNGRHF